MVAKNQRKDEQPTRLGPTVSQPPCGVDGCGQPSDVAMLGDNGKTLMACREHVYPAMMEHMEGGPARIVVWTRLFHPENVRPEARPAMDAAVALASRGIDTAVVCASAGDRTGRRKARGR
jgi:hypothetical protein